MALLDLAARTAIAVVFAIAVGGKLRSRVAYAAFVTSLDGAVPGSVRARRRTAAAVASAEVLVLPLLVVAPGAGYALAAALLAVFAAGILRAVRRGARLRCRCFGSTGGHLTTAHAMRNVVLAALAVAGAAAYAAGADADPAPAVVATATGLLVALVATRLDDLLFLFRPANGAS
jgi:hypothetical protein